MATLDNDDFTSIRQYITRDPIAKAEFKSWGIDKATWKALFQEAEDWFVNGFTTTPTTSFKGALDAVAAAALPDPFTVTNAQAKQIGYVWTDWRQAKRPA